MGSGSYLYSLNSQKISCLAENTRTKVVFNEVLAMAGRDLVTKDISRLCGGWPMQDAFHVSTILYDIFEKIFIISICPVILNFLPLTPPHPLPHAKK